MRSEKRKDMYADRYHAGAKGQKHCHYAKHRKTNSIRRFVTGIAALVMVMSLYMAMGSDMLLSFDSWHRWQEILRLARLVVTSRNVGDAPELHAKAKQMDPTGARILFAQVEALPMASSNLRTRLAAGEACENELPALVRRVIRREGLYRADRGESGNHESETGKGACARSVE